MQPKRKLISKGVVDVGAGPLPEPSRILETLNRENKSPWGRLKGFVASFVGGVARKTKLKK